MTNGYCLEGYDGESGLVNYGIESYANKYAAWLAVSGMRSQDVQWMLELDYENTALMEEIYANEYHVTSWDEELESLWYDTWGFVGDRRTWSDLCDAVFRLGTGAAKILSVYNTDGNDEYFKSSYADETEINKAIAGVESNPYYPSSKSEMDEFVGYKYLQIGAEYFQKSVEDADVISLAVGNTNFGTFMLTEILDVIMSDDYSFAERYSYDRVMAQVADDTFTTEKVNAILASENYQKSVAACKALADGDESKAERIEYIVKYCMASYIVGYIGMMEDILEVNPDA